jgi:hypothetical protein
MPYVTVGLAAYGLIDSYSKSQKAKKSIDALKKVNPKYRDALDIQRQAEASVKTGFSPEEAAAFQQGLTRTNNAQYRLATDRNPNLAPAIQAGINYGNIGAQADFAAKDAALRRQRVNDLVGQITGQSNNQTQADLMNKRDQEIAYGNAKSQQDAQIYNSISMMAAGVNNGISTGNTTGTTTQVEHGGGTYELPATPLQSNRPPAMSAQNPPPIDYGSNQWAQMLYGNPNVPTSYPLRGNYMAPPNQRFNTNFDGYYYK